VQPQGCWGPPWNGVVIPVCGPLHVSARCNTHGRKIRCVAFRTWRRVMLVVHFLLWKCLWQTLCNKNVHCALCGMEGHKVHFGNAKGALCGINCVRCTFVECKFMRCTFVECKFMKCTLWIGNAQGALCQVWICELCIAAD
jgi:hypothetical protein